MDVPHDMEGALSPADVLVGIRPVQEADWESSLVRNCQSGDPEAFRLLVERYQSRVFSIAHSLVRSRADVEDIAQQVFTKVYFALHSFDFRCALITWIYRITINECYDHLRRTRSKKMFCISEISEADCRQLERAPALDIAPDRQAELGQIVSMLLEKVSADERVLLMMKEVEGYSIQDLARVFGWNQNTVKVKLFRARKRLAQVARKRLPNNRKGGQCENM
jgi:RNA polymerase sigma-70 factor (ECF subfamily)